MCIVLLGLFNECSLVQLKKEKSEEMHLKVQGIFGETFLLILLSSAVFRPKKPCLRFFLVCFTREIK